MNRYQLSNAVCLNKVCDYNPPFSMNVSFKQFDSTACVFIRRSECTPPFLCCLQGYLNALVRGGQSSKFKVKYTKPEVRIDYAAYLFSIKAFRQKQHCIVVFAEIGGAAGIDSRTAKSWISVLESSGIVILLRPYAANLSERIIRDRKIYPIEVKKEIGRDKADKNFKVLDQYGLPVSAGLIINTGDGIIPLNRDAYYCPVGMIGL